MLLDFVADHFFTGNQPSNRDCKICTGGGKPVIVLLACQAAK
jgi:hypothetical protein